MNKFQKCDLDSSGNARNQYLFVRCLLIILVFFIKKSTQCLTFLRYSGESASEFPIYQKAESDRPWCTVATGKQFTDTLLLDF